MIPEWLARNEQYTPRSDRDAFVDKSIVSILGLFSRFRSPGPRGREKLNINAGVKLASALLLILLLSLSHSPLFVVFAGALMLALLSLHRGELILRVLRVGLPVAAFTFVMLLPFVVRGNFSGPLMMTTKVFVSVSAVKLFASTEEWESISGALRALFVPQLFILVLDITIKYLLLLGEYSLRMLYALKLRSVGRNRNKTASLSGIAGILFLQSREMAQDMYAAMECRCFTGRYRARRVAKFSPADLVPLMIDALLLLVFFMART
jgi:cobalt/nickel transport system permease protein